jgi:7-cyano-7-deazaguanine reductase
MSSDQLLQSPLGKQSLYVSQYDPGQLCPIPRHLTWKEYAYSQSPYFGLDIWNAYEISWLNSKGLPQVAVGEFRIPLSTPNLIESKSFKLYLNSFNQTKISNKDQLCKILESDISACAGELVKVKLFAMNHVQVTIQELGGMCLDDLDVKIEVYKRDARLLHINDEPVLNEKLYSHLLKTNCPVTGQPDWGSVYIEYSGKSIEHSSLLKYIVSYREHCDFHEQCVENIFLDIMQQCQPDELTVYARYLRRGGLDINPYRSTKNNLPDNSRLIRQ